MTITFDQILTAAGLAILVYIVIESFSIIKSMVLSKNNKNKNPSPILFFYQGTDDHYILECIITPEVCHFAKSMFNLDLFHEDDFVDFCKSICEDVGDHIPKYFNSGKNFEEGEEIKPIRATFMTPQWIYQIDVDSKKKSLHELFRPIDIDYISEAVEFEEVQCEESTSEEEIQEEVTDDIN
jgi:hypothetical protein